MKNKKQLLVIGIISLIISISLGFTCSYIYLSNNKVEEVVDSPKEVEQEEILPVEDNKKVEEPPYENILPTIRSQYGNNNIVAKLEIPNIGIDSFVTRTVDNSYYLSYNYYNQYDALGVPFIDYRNTNLSSDKQINIYGHNTQNEKFFNHLPFIKLESYTNKKVFNTYKDIYLNIDEKRIHYKVIAIKIIDDSNNEHMKVLFHDKQDFLSHASSLIQNSLYRDEMIEITSDDRLLVLQVCHYNPPDTYLLVIGKEIIPGI